MNDSKIKRIVGEHYTIIEELGSGSFGMVFKVTRKNWKKGDGPEVIALKAVPQTKEMFAKNLVLFLFCICSDTRARAYLEFNFQHIVKSNNVVQVFKQFVDRNLLLIEMEYVGCGSLLDLFRNCLSKKTLLSSEDVWIIFLQLLKGIDGLNYFVVFLCSVLFFIKIIRQKTSYTAMLNRKSS
jgi:serine/threonine protein kinase